MICLERETLDKLSSKGILAYVAVMQAGDAVATTAALAALVRAQTAVMLEGIKELEVEAPRAIGKLAKGKWKCGSGGEGLVVQNLDSDRYRLFVDDIKKYWEFLNPVTPPFSMGAMDGAAIRRFLSNHREWSQEHWRKALNSRARSVERHGAGSRSASIFSWVQKLADYSAGPLNEYGKPVEGTGKHGQAVSVELANSEAKRAYLNGQV